MESTPTTRETYVPEAGSLVELADTVPASAKEALREHTSDEKFLVYAIKISSGDLTTLYVGPNDPSVRYSQFNPNITYEDGPFARVIPLSPADIKPIDYSKTAKILPFRRK